MSWIQKVALVITLLAVAFSATFACRRVADRGRFATPYSTFSAGPQGLRALVSLTHELGFRTHTQNSELSNLSQLGTLVAAAGCGAERARLLSRPEREALSAWIARGGLLIVMGVDSYVPHEIGLTLSGLSTCDETLSEGVVVDHEPTPKERDEEGDADAGELEQRDAAQAEERAPGVEDEAAQMSTPLADDEPPEDELGHGLLMVPGAVRAHAVGAPLSYLEPLEVRGSKLVEAKNEQATELLQSVVGSLAMTVPHGRGRVVLLGSASPFTNAQLGQGGAAVFARLLRAFAPRGPVAFDEYHLGMGERRSVVGYLRERGLGYDLLQLCACVLAFLWSKGARLGPPENHPPPVPRSTRNFMAALGALFARTRDANGALAILSRHGLMRIAAQQKAHGVALSELEPFLREQGLPAVADYAARVREAGTRPLAPRETLQSRADELERDVRAALAIGVS